MSTSSRRRRSSRPANRRLASNIIASSAPATIDRSREYAFIRRDLVRILIYGGGLIAIMVVLNIAGVF
jgi:hypothetical protein